MKLEFSRQIFEKAQVSKFVKILLVEAELFHVEGRKNGQTWWSWQSLFEILRMCLSTLDWLTFFEASKNVYSLENVNRDIFVYNFAL
jgi:hypothetical protein